MANSDIAATYKGFRLQILYTLYRVLETDSTGSMIFQPEGQEDLAVLDNRLNLIEIVQVKAYKDPLTLSDFHPSSEDSFFPRVAQQLGSFPSVDIKVATFGPVGAELREGWTGSSIKRELLAKKLAGHGKVTISAARKLMGRIRIEDATEVELEHKILDLLRQYATGVNPECAFSVLMHWLYQCAENKTRISQSDLIQRIHLTSRYLAESQRHHAEWFTTIQPLEDKSITDDDREKLAEHFYRGISARYDHILAGLDVIRKDKLHEINSAFAKSNIVIVHGASGQGKSTLAYRYMHTAFADPFRFEVQAISNPRHALDVALALSGHAEAIGVPIGVHIDVALGESGWQVLLDRLSMVSKIKVLVTIRQEDWNREPVTDYDFPLQTIDLNLNEDTAEQIYESLVQRKASTSFIGFRDAWLKFGEEGPLLEFVFLITQGASLRTMLTKQINRLRELLVAEKLIPAELELLRLVALASAYGARLKVRPLGEHLRILDIMDRTLDLLQKEYLLLPSFDNNLVGGLHPIRSEIVSSLLTTDRVFTWGEKAAICLPLIHEPDIETFLLHAASRRRMEFDSLQTALDAYQPTTWAASIGIVRTLLWLGVAEYVNANSDVIKGIQNKTGESWWTVLNFDLAGAMPGSSSNVWETFGGMLPEAGRQEIQNFRQRQTDMTGVFDKTKYWLASRTSSPQAPASLDDWRGFAEVNFWIGRLEIASTLAASNVSLDFTDAIDTLPLEVLADVVAGATYSSPTLMKSLGSDALLTRFQRDTDSVAVTDDGKSVTAHFIYQFQEENPTGQQLRTIQRNPNSRIHAETLTRVELLRRLFPAREVFCTHGYGHQLESTRLEYDPTHKEIRQENLPYYWAVRSNRIFIGLGMMSMRKDTWPEFASDVIKMRKTALQTLQLLKTGLEAHFRKKEPVQILGPYVPPNLWDLSSSWLLSPPILPKCAVDEWGLIRESSASSSTPRDADWSIDQIRRVDFAAREYYSFWTEYKRYTSSLGTFFKQGVHTLGLHLGKGRLNEHQQKEHDRIRSQYDVDFIRLSAYNLGEALEALPSMQKEFRRLLAPYISAEELTQLEIDERRECMHVWGLWYYFAFQPSRLLQDPIRNTQHDLAEIAKGIKKSLRKGLQRMNTPEIRATIASDNLQWEGAPSICVAVDTQNPLGGYQAADSIISIMHDAVRPVDDVELRLYALKFHWQHLVIIPLVRGKSLRGTAWRLPIFTLGNDDGPLQIKWWNLIPRPIPQEVKNVLKIQTWAHPRLPLGERLVDSTGITTLLAEHANDLSRIPDPNNVGQEVLNNYTTSLAKQISNEGQRALTAIGEIQRFITDTLTLDEVVKRLNLYQVLQHLEPLQQSILPEEYSSEEKITSVQDITAWAVKLTKAREQAQMVYCLWATDILDEISPIRGD